MSSLSSAVEALVRHLEDAVRRIVREELERVLAATQRPLSKSELAASLGCSTATIDRHVRAGMPYQKKGTHRVFDLTACRAWLRDRPARPRKPDVLDQVTLKTRAGRLPVRPETTPEMKAAVARSLRRVGYR